MHGPGSGRPHAIGGVGSGTIALRSGSGAATHKLRQVIDFQRQSEFGAGRTLTLLYAGSAAAWAHTGVHGVHAIALSLCRARLQDESSLKLAIQWALAACAGAAHLLSVAT